MKDGKKFDSDKPRMDLLPFNAIEEVAKVLTYGLKKYGQENGWKRVENALPRYEAALLRHYAAYKQGESHDSESGLLHLSHMACNALFILSFELDAVKIESDNES